MIITETPQAYIKRMLRELGNQTDDATIAGMCRTKYRNQVPPERVAELRREVKR